jgi:hypothetical protein
VDNPDQKDQPGLTKRVVSVRKYRQCAADYLKLAKEPNTMREVAERYLRIAAYYLELADTEDTDEGDANSRRCTSTCVPGTRWVTNADSASPSCARLDRLDEGDLGGHLAATHSKAPAGEPA